VPHEHTYELDVPSSAIDANGHANNVEFVRWMQDAAVAHGDARGLNAMTRDAGMSWVVRSHQVHYLRPAFAGDHVRVRTWVESFRRASSKRGYEFVRDADGAVLAKGETEWVLVDAKTGRPRGIPEAMTAMFAAL
jgi:acyl-CoA thioester hydrolase